MGSARRALWVAGATLLMMGCRGLGDMTAPRPVETPVATVTLSVEQVALSEGASVALQVTALDENRRPITDRTAVWSSSDTTAARVSIAGLVTAIRAGNAQIAVSVDGHSATASVTITARSVATVQVTPSAPSVLKGGVVQLTARTLDDAGGVLTNRPVSWGTSDARVLVVDVGGLMTGIAPGVATVTATSESRSAAVGVTVLTVPVASVLITPTRDSIVVGQTTQIVAIPRDSTGARLDDLVTFSSNASSVATVSASGVVLGISAGSALITASSGGRSAAATIIVQSRPVGAVIVSPAQSALTVGQSVRLTVQVTDATGTLLSGRPTTFSSSAANIARVAADGLVVALAPGAATITAVSEGKSGTALVTVGLSPIASLQVEPSAMALLVGGSARLSAIARDAAGVVLPQRAVQWTSGAPGVVSVSTDGVVNAIGPGTAIVFANAEERLATATITVAATMPSTIAVAPVSATLFAGQSLDLAATLRDAAGQILTGRAVQWASANASVAVVSSSGRVRGVAPGIARIDATVNDVTGTSTLTIIAVPVATVSVTLGTSSIPIGQATQAIAIARDSAGGVLTGRVVTWTSTNGSVASVSPLGVVTALALGSAGIIATTEGKTGQAIFIVTAGTATTMASNSPTSQSATVSTTVGAAPSVKITDAAGAPVAGVAVTFTVTAGSGSIVPASPGTLTTNAGGIATLTSWTLGALAGTNTVIASAAGLAGSPLLFAANGTAGAPTQLAVTTQPAGAASGVAFATQPVIAIRDAANNVTSSTATVSVALASGTGVLSGTLTATAVNGMATFTNLAITGTGAHTLTFTSGALTPTTSASFPVGSVATQLVVTTQPAGAVSGAAFGTQPVIAVRDAANNLTPSTATVTAAIASGTGLLSGTLTATAVNGVATFANLRITGLGAHTLIFTSPGLTSATSTTFTVAVGGPTQLVVTTQPAGAASGAVFTTQPVVAIRDAGNNPTTSTATVTAAIASGTGVLSGTLSATAVNGVATFSNLRITGTGAHTLAFTSVGLTSATSASFPVTVSAPTQLALTTQPAGAVNGGQFATQPVIAIRDAGGNLANSSAAVTAVVASGTGTLAGNTTVAAVNGVATFTNLTIFGIGLHTLTFTSGALTPTTSVSFGVSGGATQLALTTQPAGAASATAFTTQPVVAIRDAGGNLTTSTATVTAAIASGSGVLSGTLSVTAVSGVATFTNLTITGTGPHTLTFTAGAFTPATSSSFTVAAGLPTQLTITTQPTGAVSGLTFTTQPVIAIRDAGNNLTNSTATVTAAIATGAGTLSGTTSVTAVNGVATFTNLRIAGGGAHTLTFTSVALTPATSTAFTVTQAAVTLAMQTQPGGAVTGTAFTTQPVVRILDNAGLLVTTGPGATLTVTAAIGTGTGTLSGTVAVTAVNGVATFTNLVITGTGAHTLAFTSGALTPVTSSTFTVSGVPTQLAVTTQPAGAVSSVTFTTQPVVAIRDVNNNLTVSNATVTVAIASGSGVLTGTLTATAVSGVATFTNLRITGTGAHTLIFTSAGLTPAASASFTVAAGPPTQLAVTTQPAGAVSSVPFTTQPVIAIRDADGNVTTSTATVTAAIASGTGVLSGTLTATAVNGVATFTNLQIRGIGPHTVAFTSAALTAATSASFPVAAGPPTQLAITTQPAGAVSFVVFTTQPVVAIRDADNNLTTSTATVTVAIASGTGVLSGTLTATAVSGVATFANLRITGVGPHTLTFTSGALTAATSASFTVAAGPPTQLALTTQPGGAVSGVAFTTQPVVAIRDAGGNLTNSTATVTAAIASGTGTLVGTTAVAAVNGVATFTDLRIDGAGAHTLTFTSGALTPTTSGSVVVTQAPALIALQTAPAGAVTGLPFATQPVLRILDNAGLLVTTGPGATLAVTAAIASGTGVLGGTVTATAVGGVVTFTNLQITGTGVHTLRFTSGALPPATTANFTVSGVPTQLAITTQPAGAVSGVAFTTQPVIAIRDASNNLTSSTGTVTAAIASGTGTLSGTTSVAAVNGVATFTNLRITGLGAHTLTFTSGALTPTTSASFTVASGVPTQLAITAQPSGAVTGVAFTTQPVIAIRDAANNPTTSTATVTAAIASGTGVLGGTVSVAAVNGVATFTNLQIAGTGAHTLTFTSGGLTAATSASFVVAAGPPSQLAITTQPGGAVNGGQFATQPVIAIRDAANNLTNSTAPVTVAIASGTGSLSGTTTVNAVNGVATFTNLVITGTGAHTLTFTSGALTPATSVSFIVTGAAVKLAVATQPAGAVTGVAFTTQPVITILDAGNNVTPSTATVTVAIASGTGVLSGTLTAIAVNGVATFTNLRITGIGPHTLTFTSGALTAATSASFTVASGPATQLAITTQPGGAANGVAFTTQPVIAIRDAGGNLTTSTATITVAIASGTGVLSGTLSVAAVNGVATFTNLRITGTGAHTLVFSSAGLTSATSVSFVVP